MIHYNSTVQIPNNRCAFHESNFISHFCKYQECLLPLCKQCLPIHRRQHGTMKAPIDVCSIEQECWSVKNQIQGEIVRLEGLYYQIAGKVNFSNQLHSQLQKSLILERDKVIHGVSLYYGSLSQQIDHNYQRRQSWLHEIAGYYNSVRQEMLSLVQRLQTEQHLRTVIMWDRLHPQRIINEISKQAKRELQPPSIVPCDIQQLITTMSKNHKMTILDLQGDICFSQLSKALYNLRFGQQQSVLSSKQGGISLISRESKLSHKLSICKSTDRV